MAVLRSSLIPGRRGIAPYGPVADGLPGSVGGAVPSPPPPISVSVGSADGWSLLLLVGVVKFGSGSAAAVFVIRLVGVGADGAVTPAALPAAGQTPLGAVPVELKGAALVPLVVAGAGAAAAVAGDANPYGFAAVGWSA